MQRRQLKFNGKKIGDVFTFFEDYKTRDTKIFCNKIARQIKPIMGYGYAGFSNRKFLQDNLNKNIFDAQTKNIRPLNISQSKVLRVIARSVGTAQQKLPIDSLRVYVMPSFNSFIGKQMGGTSGTSPWKNTFLLFINPTPGWDNYLAGTVIHEYNHAVASQYHNWSTLRNKIILEGLAEVFLEEVLPQTPLFVGKTISQLEAKKYFKQARRHMNSVAYKIYNEVFYKNEKYPLWAGYGIGYWIVKSFRKKHPKIPWHEIIRLNPRQIIKQSGFDK